MISGRKTGFTVRKPAARAERSRMAYSGGIPGFTICELLVVTAVVCVFALLAFGAMNGGREAEKQVRCMDNLRRIGVGNYLYQSDFGGYDFATSAQNYMRQSWMRWHQIKWVLEYLPGMDESDVWGCPSLRKTQDPNETYGRLHTDDFPEKYKSTAISGEREIAFPRVSEIAMPGMFIYVADTLVGRTGRQRFVFRKRPGPNTAAIHMRHGEKANIGFADGHVENIDFNGILERSNASMSPVSGFYWEVYTGSLDTVRE